MIIFHEGMPRSGKSYSAFVDHIFPALKAGRKVYARLDGIDWSKIAGLADMTEERCRELLIHLEPEDIPTIYKYGIENDSLVVIDELQNYFPYERRPLSPEMTQFIAEHGHHGLDILNMGQVLKDCHKTWINRTNRKLQYIKKDMLGKPDEFKWTMYTGSLDKNGNVKFTEVSKGDGTYDPKYFGCYKSHSDGTDNKGTYADERVNIWKSPIFRKWIPLLGVMSVCSLGYVVYLFKGGLATTPAQAATPVKEEVKPVRSVTTVSTVVDGKEHVDKVIVDGKEQTQVSAKEKDKEEKTKVSAADPFEVPDVVTELSKSNRIRLGMLMRTATRTRVVIEWRDSSQRIVESLTEDDLSLLGYQVATTNSNSIALVAKGDKRYFATAWPLEDIAKGKVSESEKEDMRETGRWESRRMPIEPRQRNESREGFISGPAAQYSRGFGSTS